MTRTRKNRTAQILQTLAEYESRNITYIDPDGSWPVVWERAAGVHVWDAEGRRYLDLTAAFGVAAAGHANPRVVNAGQMQMRRLLHAMGDVHPHALKGELARVLSRITFERWTDAADKTGAPHSSSTGKTIFCNSGFEAVEAALKTAILATGKPGIIAFEGGYHGLGYGALNATHREHFRRPFDRQLGRFGHFVPFPSQAGAPGKTDAVLNKLAQLLKREEIGAVIVEPIQARGGINVPADDFLPRLAKLSSAHGALLILDEIYTGFGRTGRWFACEHSGVIPDIICLGKALTGGFPLAACVGNAELMDRAWPPSSGEAIHTSTFLGHPVGCAMALANIREIHAKRLVEGSAKLGTRLRELLGEAVSDIAIPQCRIRGRGLMAGVALADEKGAPATEQSLQVIKEMLHRGFILLPEGECSSVISFTPPLTITERQLAGAVKSLRDTIQRLPASHGSFSKTGRS